MQIMDSPTRYGAVTRFFHWSIATLILWQLLSMVLKNTLGRENAIAGFMTGTHGTVGFVTFVLVVLRVFWALANLGRRPSHAGLSGLAAKLGHLALYVLMIVVPGVALLRAYGGERAFSVFGIQIFGPRLPDQVNQTLVDLGGNWHGELAWLLAALILGHVVMAVIHRAVMKDRIMARMAG